MTVINTANPYTHFNSFSSPCFNKLFLGVVDDAPPLALDNDDDDDGFVWQLPLID